MSHERPDRWQPWRGSAAFVSARVNLVCSLYYNKHMTRTERVVTFRPDEDILEAMEVLRDRDGVPFSQQVRRALPPLAGGEARHENRAQAAGRPQAHLTRQRP